jgi:hypothetical protein
VCSPLVMPLLWVLEKLFVRLLVAVCLPAVAEL